MPLYLIVKSTLRLNNLFQGAMLAGRSGKGSFHPIRPERIAVAAVSDLSLPVRHQAGKPVCYVQQELLVLLRPWRPQTEPAIVSAGPLRRKHRGLTERGDAPSSDLRDSGLVPPVHRTDFGVCIKLPCDIRHKRYRGAPENE